MIIHAYIDRQVTSLLERYELAQAEHRRTREQLQQSLLRQVLEGQAVLPADEIEQVLGLRLDGQHLGIAVRTNASPHDSGLAGHLARMVPGSRVLAYRHEVRLWLVWVSHPHGVDGARLCELRTALRRTRLRAAIGSPARGLSGLASTARDALDAARLQEMLGPMAERVVAFDDLRLESLSLTDPERTLRFVRDELHDLDADDDRAAVLRDTAQTWLTTGSHVSTAGRLGIHEHTVRNRIAQIEALVGRSITSRRTELLVALRLRKILDKNLAAS